MKKNIWEKHRNLLIGITGLALGYYLIFIKHKNGGFIPAIIGLLFLLWKFKK